jgi:hypothetical protein
MSVRTQPSRVPYATAAQLRQDIEFARQADAASELTFDQLTEVEKSAATIGVSPEAWRPISWMNEAHYGELLKNNVLGGRLTQQIEAFKSVATRG